MQTWQIIYRKYQNFRPFTEPEAWTLFKAAAIAEAIGWTTLIIGIYYRNYVVHANWPVAIAGQIHGTLFLAYIFAVLALSPSMGWPLWRVILAGSCSVPPYGSLLYEQISAVVRKRTKLQRFYRQIMYTHISSLITY